MGIPLPAVRSPAERNALVMENMGLAYAVVHRAKKVYPWLCEDDLTSLAHEVLLRVCDLYRPETGFAISTFYFVSWFRRLKRLVSERTKRDVVQLTDLQAEALVDHRGDADRRQADTVELVEDLIRGGLKGRHWARERRMIRMRAKGLTLEAIGEKFGVTKERVRQRLGRAFEQVRKYARENVNEKG